MCGLHLVKLLKQNRQVRPEVLLSENVILTALGRNFGSDRGIVEEFPGVCLGF